MSHHTTSPKIQNFINHTIKNQLNEWLSMLVTGNIYEFEKELHQACMDTYEFICEQLLPMAADRNIEKLTRQGHAAGGRKIETRSLPVRIGTGKKITVNSPYVKKPPEDWTGSRHLLANHWHIIGGATPALYDKVGYCAALGPSYEVGHQTLSKFGLHISQSSVRDLTNHLATHCFDFGEEYLMLDPKEDVSEKTVVLSMDGGRTRTREYTGQVNDAGNSTYQTAWREPKLLVIDILDETGRPDRHELPVYGCRFSEEDVLKLLERYLIKLNIHKANRVQVIGDGAAWIWKNVKPMLLKLGVTPDRITETLDYYHASQYVHDLVEQMPKRINSKQRKEYLHQFKDHLWKGKSGQIVSECRKIFKRPGDLVNRWINYLQKHSDKTQYVDYESNGLMCGSGIIESAIRRIICLRFKNASTFWYKENVEKLYFLRAAILSKRWEIVIRNLAHAV
jgi:hypothetical protein